MQQNKIYFKIRNEFPISTIDIEKRIISHLKKRGSENSFIELNIIGKKKMRSINKEFLNHDYPTDVLSFPQSDYPIENSGLRFIGTILICSDIIKSQAKKNAVKFEEEFFFYLLHGIDHLLGIHHS